MMIKADGTEVPASITAAWGCTVTPESTPKPTGIHAIQYVKAENNDAIYNLQGQRIKNPQKGVYIQNGRKFVVR